MAALRRRAFLAAAALFSPLAWIVGETQAQSQAFSLDDFLALSSRLTGRTNLDRAAADALLKALRSKPGYDARLPQPDAALDREIIVAWYTGTQARSWCAATVTMLVACFCEEPGHSM